MHGKLGLVIASIVVAAVSGCSRKLEPGYCEANFGVPDFKDRVECCNEYPEYCQPGGACESATDCSFETPHCIDRLGQKVCVQCLANDECPADAPVCDQANTCVACQKHADCASDLCLEDGACAAAGDVAYVTAPSGTANMMCTRDMPCLTLVQALNAMPSRRYIRVTGSISAGPGTALSGLTVGIYGTPEMTIITRTMNGPVLEIKNTANVALVDLQIIGGPDKEAVLLKDVPGPLVSMTRVKVRAPNGDGIVISDGNLTMTDSELEGSRDAGVSLVKGSLTMTGSRVLNNGGDGVKAVAGTVDIRGSTISTNRGTAGVFTVNASMVTIDSSIITRNIGTNGGASIVGPLSIRNSVISRNGDGATIVGGLTLSSSNATLEFNTIADNISNMTPGLGISCLNLLDISNNILTGNAVNGCNATYSLADTLLPGMGNKIGAPMFLSTDAANPSSPMFYRIRATSAAKDSADPMATLGVDIDGQPRIGPRDIGADESN